MGTPARDLASVRTRLILVPSFVLCAGIVAAIIVTLLAARNRIDAETLSGVDLAGLVIRYALEGLDTASDPAAVLEQLRQDLEKVRHVQVSFVPGAGGDEPPPAENAVPWSLLAPGRVVARYPVAVAGMPHGTLVMATRPSDEAAEIWSSLAFLVALLAAVATAIAVVILITARQTLKPLADLVEGLRRLKQGRFDALAEIKVAELHEIGSRFNELAESLDRTRADNRLLVDRLMATEDRERKALARELHDELGAALFGIRVAASCIMEHFPASRASGRIAKMRQEEDFALRSGATGAEGARERATAGAIADPADDIVKRAQTISSLAEALQAQSRRMLERVRPQVLQRLGVGEALSDLADRWRGTHRDIACDLTVPAAVPRMDEETGATLYRILQEGLTNVARHSGARRVRVTLDIDGDGDERDGMIAARLTVEDDGKGLPPYLRFGFGLLGMTERVRKLGGSLQVTNGDKAGTRIEAIIPLEPASTVATVAAVGEG
jgi:two-component system sensor histidine kinase UhpB